MSFVATITANIDDFSKNLDKAGKDMDKFSQNISQKLNKVGDSFVKVGGQMSVLSGAIAGVVAGMGALALSTAQYTKDLDSLSTITGISTDMLQEYELIALKATVPTDALAQATMSLTRRLKDVSEEGGGATEVLKKLGISLKDTNGQMKSAGQIAEDAMFALSKLGGGVEASALGVQLFGRQWNDVVQIVDLGADEISRLKDEAHDLGLVLDKEAITSSANFGIAVDVLKLRLTALKNQIGTALAPLLTDTLLPLIENKIMPAFQKWTESIKGLIERFNALSPQTKTLIAGITGLAVATGPTLVALGGILKLLPLLSAGFAALTSPISLIVLAVAGAAVAIVKHWDEIVNYFTVGDGAQMWETIRTAANNLKSDLTTIFQDLKNTIKPIWDSIGDDLTQSFKQTSTSIGSAINFIVETFDNFLDILRAANPKEALEPTKKFFIDFANGIKDGLSPIKEGAVVVRDLTQAQIDAMTAGNKWGLQVNDTTGKVDDLNQSLKAQGDAIDNYVSPKIKKLSDEYLKLSTSLAGVKANIGGERIGNFNIGGNEIDFDITPEINIDNEGIAAKMQLTKAVITNQIGKITEGVTIEVEALNGVLVGGFTDMFSALGDALGSGSSVLDSLGNALLGGIGSMAVQLGQLAIGIGGAIFGIKKALQSLNPVVAIAAGVALVTLGSFAKSAASSIGSGSGGYARGAGGYQSTRVEAPIQQGEFDVRGSYRFPEKIELVATREGLGATIDMYNDRRNRNV